MSVRVITGKVIKSNSNPSTSGKTYSKGVEVKKTSSSTRVSSAGSSKSSPVTSTSPVKANVSSSPITRTSPVKANISSSPTSITASEGVTPMTPSTSDPQEESFSTGGGRGGLGDTSDGFASLSTGERFATLGESLNADWEYYKPVAGLALWEARAAEQILAKASNAMGKIIGKYGNRIINKNGLYREPGRKTTNWAQDTLQRTGMPAVTEKAGKVVLAANSKTKFFTKKNLIRAGFSVMTAGLMSILPGKVFGEFELSEATQVISFARTKAVAAGDTESVAVLDDSMNELLNQSKWQEFFSYMPFVGALGGIAQHMEAARTSNQVYQRLDTFVASGDSSIVDWEKTRQEQIATEKTITDYRIEQNTIYQNNERIADLNHNEKVAAFWRDNRRKNDKMELEQLQRVSDFWDEYNKKKAEYEADSALSFTKLSFGLL